MNYLRPLNLRKNINSHTSPGYFIGGKFSLPSFLIILFSIFLFNPGFSQSGPVGIFEGSSDIGNPRMTGSASYDEQTQTYTLKGGGYNIWFNRDEFRYLYKKMAGDFILTADFELMDAGTDPHRNV